MKKIMSPSAKRANRAARIILTVMITAMLCSVFAFATTTTLTGETEAAGGIEAGVKQGLSAVYTTITSIVLPIAAVCLAFAGFKIFAGGEKGMESAKKIILYTLIAVAIVYLAPVIVLNVGNWFQDYSVNTTVFD